MRPQGLRTGSQAGTGGGSPSRPNGGPARILLVDAARDRRHGLRLLLEDSRMTVFEAASGTEALAVAGIVRPDVAVIDLRIPDRDGLALSGQLHCLVPGLTVLIHGTADRAALLRAALRAGALDVVDGAAEPAAVVEAIREAVSIGRTTAELAARSSTGGTRTG